MISFWQKLTTSKNLTLLGVLVIIAACAQAGIQLFDGDPNTNVDWKWFFGEISVGLVGIGAKGQSNTGGVVPSTPEAAARVIKGQNL